MPANMETHFLRYPDFFRNFLYYSVPDLIANLRKYFLMIFLGNPEGGHRNFCIPIVFRAAHHPGGAHQPEHRREVRHDVPLPVPAGEEGHSEGGLSLL